MNSSINQRPDPAGGGFDPGGLLLRLGERLIRQNKMVATAESCTGGGIAYAMTSLSGSSRWFERGFVTYSNRAKIEQLSVADEIITRFGAVSEEVAAAMSIGALNHSHADLSVSVTGIAGPDGGTTEKPTGTVCFGWSRRDGDTRTTRVLFQGNRQQVREQSILMAIQGLLDIVEAI